MIHIELPLSKSQVNRALIAVAAKGNLLPWLSEHPEIAAQGCRDTRLMAEALQKHHRADLLLSHRDRQGAERVHAPAKA